MSDDARRPLMEWVSSVCLLAVRQNTIGRDQAFGSLSRTIAYPLGEVPTEWAFDPIDWTPKPLTIDPPTDGGSFGAPA